MKKIFALMVVFVLVGCIGGYSAQSKFYMLKTSDSEPITKQSYKIGVEPVKIPAYLDKPQIVMMQPDGITLQISETNRWAENLSTLLQRTLIDDFSVRMPKASVQAKAFNREELDYIVFVNVNQFDGVFNSRLTLKVNWTLMNDKGDTLYYTQSVLTASLSDSYDDLVLQQSELWGQLSGEIAKKIVSLK